ncbi:MAG TPA: hypothetical protein DD377_01665 [Firmicutes bacterium]|nr:hypothetical protein [Bacillota bacterium]
MEKMKLKKMDLGDVSTLIEEALKGLKNDPIVYKEISSLSLTAKEVKDNLATLLSYQEDVSYCSSCPGMDKCKKDNPLYEMSLFKEGGVLNREFSPCKVYLDYKEKLNRFFIRDFPIDYLNNSISSIDKDVKRNKALKRIISSLNLTTEDWVYLKGKTRSGKTYILSTFASNFASRYQQCAYVNTSSLLENLKKLSFDNKMEFETIFGKLKNAPLLVFDDFGNEYKSEYSFSSFLYPILLYRNEHRLRTFFASPFSIEEVVSMYKSKIGLAFSRQLDDIIRINCKEEIDITSVNLY